MDPFIKKMKTQAEKDALLKQARIEFDQAGAMNFLIAPTWEDYIAGIEASIEVEQLPFEAPPTLTAVQKADFDRSLAYDDVLDRILRVTDNSTGCKAIDDAWQAHEEAELRKFLKPARDQESALDKMVAEAVARALRKVSGGDNQVTIIPKPVPGREGLMPLLRNAVDENSDAAKFLAGFIAGDEGAMRKVIREMVRAEAA